MLNCSANRVNYWLKKHSIQKRTISEAVYIKHNPNGDPFKVSEIRTIEHAELLGYGLGLYWGEGTKANKYSVRLGNSDPKLILKFMEFLEVLFGIDRTDFKFGLQIFNDTDPSVALNYWVKELDIMPDRFYKMHITPSTKPGTYKKKNYYGVATIYYHNKKLRDIIVGLLPR